MDRSDDFNYARQSIYLTTLCATAVSKREKSNRSSAEKLLERILTLRFPALTPIMVDLIPQIGANKDFNPTCCFGAKICSRRPDSKRCILIMTRISAKSNRFRNKNSCAIYRSRHQHQSDLTQGIVKM